MLGNQTQIHYLRIVNNKIAKAVKETTPGAVEFVNSEGTARYYHFHDFVEGMITNITKQSPPPDHPEWSGNWNIHMKDNNEEYCLSLNIGSKFALTFFSVAPNLDFNLPVKFQPRGTADERSLFISQPASGNDSALKWAYTRDNPGPCPPLDVTTTKSGKKIYDDFERNEFFTKVMHKINAMLVTRDQGKAVEPPSVDAKAEPSIDAKAEPSVATERQPAVNSQRKYPIPVGQPAQEYDDDLPF